jgi:hypothetical protein
MPAPESPRRGQPESDRAAASRTTSGQDLSAIPAFIRATSRRTTEAGGAATGQGARAGTALPRPVTPAPPAAPRASAGPTLDPASLPMPSLSRRRVITAAGVLLAGLLTLSFVRQVGEATTASDRATELRALNAALRDDVARLERDLGHVQDVRFIRLEGRSFGLGGPREIPFALAAGAPSLTADAPGSASVRLGAEPQPASPLDAWLEVLFGGGR